MYARIYGNGSRPRALRKPDSVSSVNPGIAGHSAAQTAAHRLERGYDRLAQLP